MRRWRRPSTATSPGLAVSGVACSCLSITASLEQKSIGWASIRDAIVDGIGRALIEAAVEDARKRGVRYLFVATLHPDDPYEPYLRARHFYEAMGFVYVHDEQFPADPENPMAHYLKQLWLK
jgi:N-acetylglutamate synthase-like GNAT family acetyltransferase